MEPIKIIDRGRGPELAHIRITVFDVLPYLQSSWHATSIAVLFGLSTDEVLALVQYIREHEDEVLAENQKILDRIARGNPPHIEAKRRASRKKLLALREEFKQKSNPEGAHAGAAGRH